MAMTEQEWLACNDSGSMMAFLEGKASARKSRLFEVACLREIGSLKTDQQSQSAIDAAEDLADGGSGGDAITEAMLFANALGTAREIAREAIVALASRTDAAPRSSWEETMMALASGSEPGNSPDVFAASLRDAAVIVRDLFGNPFRPVTLNSAWRTSNVTALAQSIYDDRAFDRLPILADALEDAGCDNADILNHCRQSGEHVRGCWVVDLVLGRE
jgi:hypothetical protein